MEGDQGEGEVRVVVIEDLSDGGIPCSEGSGETKPASSLAAIGISSVCTDGEEEESHVKDEEEEYKDNGMTERGNKHKECEYEPSEEVEGDGGSQFLGVGTISLNNAKLGDEDDTVGKPEATVAAKGCSSEGVSHHLFNGRQSMGFWELPERRRTHKFPHASGELNHTTIEKSEAQYNVGL